MLFLLLFMVLMLLFMLSTIAYILVSTIACDLASTDAFYWSESHRRSTSDNREYTGGSAQEKYQQPGNKKMYRNENGEYPEESPNPDVGYCGS
jgi:hypothetical protein